MGRESNSRYDKSYVCVFTGLVEVIEVTGKMLKMFNVAQGIKVDTNGGVSRGAAEFPAVTHPQNGHTLWTLGTVS
jgi:hypothetical protein